MKMFDDWEGCDWSLELTRVEKWGPGSSLLLVVVDADHDTGSGAWRSAFVYECRKGTYVQGWSDRYLYGATLEVGAGPELSVKSGVWDQGDSMCCPSRRRHDRFHWDAVKRTLVLTDSLETVNRSEPPKLLPHAGGFSARRLTQRPVTDGREWLPVNLTVVVDEPPLTIRSADGTYTLTLTEPAEQLGDFQRWHLDFQQGDAAPVRIHAGVTGWAYVTPDSRYIFTEPLYVLDVKRWKQYALFDVLGIPNYTDIEAMSRDGRRLFISRRDCAMDCVGDPAREYFELTLPK